LESGADPTGFRDYEACYQKHGYGVERSSHLFVAAFAGELGVIRLLADAGADLNAMEGEGQTPLWAACMRGHIEVVRFLLSRGARRDLKGEGLTPLQVAQKYRFEAIVDLLREVPNKAPEPTRTSVTPRADARVAPAVRVAHL
jgi:ankyrin repeat protein